MMRASPRHIIRALVLASLFLAIASHPATAASVQVIGESDEPLIMDASKGLLIRLERAASTVFVADPEIADIQMKSPRLIYLLGKKPGQTTLYAVDGNERVLANRRIKVNHNLTRLREALKELVPGTAIRARTVDSSIVLSGLASSPAEAEGARRLALAMTKDPKQIVNHIAVTAPSQVHLRVRVAEVSRDVLKVFGINWDAVLTSGKFLFGLATGNPAAVAGTFLTRNLSGSTTTNSLFGRFTSNKLDLNGLIDALDDEGMITVLAEPNLTAVSGKPANFLAGGEFPILVPGGDGRITVEFKQFGVSLAFTPTILGSDRISLHVNPEVSQLSNTGAVELSGFVIPALTTRRAETTVELGNGQSFAIAGLLQNNINNDITKFPGLGDVPILGALFRSTRFQRNESELVIIITPYVVRPVSAARLSAPTDGLVPPTDTDRILHGRLYRPALQRDQKAPAIGGVHGTAAPLGFALD